MPKSREKEREKDKDKDKEVKTREPKKSHRALVRRVKKVVKRSRRKLGDEKFEKELQRTITFLARLQGTLGQSEKPAAKKPARKAKSKPRSKAATKAATKAVTKVATKSATKATTKSGAKPAPRTRRTPARKS